MWLLNRVSAKIKLIYQQVFQKDEKNLFESFPSTFFTLNNLRLRHKDDWVDIDHLIIGPSGIYCIQEINYPGIVTGDEKTWIHKTDKKTSTLNNPFAEVNSFAEILKLIIRQNEKYLFSDPLKSDDIPIYPVIINISITGRLNITNSPVPIIKPFDLKRIITINSKEDILTTDECVKLGKILSSKNTNKNAETSETNYR